MVRVIYGTYLLISHNLYFIFPGLIKQISWDLSHLKYVLHMLQLLYSFLPSLPLSLSVQEEENSNVNPGGSCAEWATLRVALVPPGCRRIKIAKQDNWPHLIWPDSTTDCQPSHITLRVLFYTLYVALINLYNSCVTSSWRVMVVVLMVLVIVVISVRSDLMRSLYRWVDTSVVYLYLISYRLAHLPPSCTSPAASEETGGNWRKLVVPTPTLTLTYTRAPVSPLQALHRVKTSRPLPSFYIIFLDIQIIKVEFH